MFSKNNLSKQIRDGKLVNTRPLSNDLSHLSHAEDNWVALAAERDELFTALVQVAALLDDSGQNDTLTALVIAKEAIGGSL